MIEPIPVQMRQRPGAFADDATVMRLVEFGVRFIILATVVLLTLAR